MDFRDLQGGRREGGSASSVLFLWESEAGSTADAVTHGGILPGIINLALLTAPRTGAVAFREGNLVSNPPEHPQQPQKASANASHSIFYHFSGH